MTSINDLSPASQQALAWRVRLIETIVSRQHDDETLVELLHAGLHQAHSEGLRDAAYICQTAADKHQGRPLGTAAGVLANAILELDKLNHRTSDSN